MSAFLRCAIAVGGALAFLAPVARADGEAKGSLNAYILSTVAVTVNASYASCPDRGVKVDIYETKNGKPEIQNRCMAYAATNASAPSTVVCQLRSPVPASTPASDFFVRLWRITSDCSKYADEAGDVSGYDDFPLSGKIQEDGGYPTSIQAEGITVDKPSYSAKISPRGGTTYEFYSKRAGHPAGSYVNALHANVGAALQYAVHSGAPASLTPAGCIGQGYYNPTQAGSACSFVGGVKTMQSTEPTVTSTCDGKDCDGAFASTLQTPYFQLLNFDYGPGYEGPSNPGDQTYFRQTVTAQTDYLEFEDWIQHRGSTRSGASQIPTGYISNQFRRVYAGGLDGKVDTVNVDPDSGQKSSALFTQKWGTLSFLTFENTGITGSEGDDFFTVGFFYSPELKQATDATWSGGGLTLSETDVFKMLDFSNALNLNYATNVELGFKYAIFPYKYDEAVSSPYGTMAVKDVITKLRNDFENPIRGYVDGYFANANQITGWACSGGTDQSIQVHLYAGGPAGTGTFVGAFSANVANEPAVTTACAAKGTAYRYAISVTDDIKSKFGGQSIWVHGISPVGASNSLLGNSGKFNLPN